MRAAFEIDLAGSVEDELFDPFEEFSGKLEALEVLLRLRHDGLVRWRFIAPAAATYLTSGLLAAKPLLVHQLLCDRSGGAIRLRRSSLAHR